MECALLLFKFRANIIYNHEVMGYFVFLIAWVVLNLIGFTLGSYFGATSVGVIPDLVPGVGGILLGDLVFGLIIGLFQWLALKFFFRRFTISASWVLLTSLGFTFGARAGSLLTYRIVNAWLTPAFVFGVIMGGSIGLATALVLRNKLTYAGLGIWFSASVLAWVLGESIAFSTDFAQATVPYVSLAISSVIGLCWLWLGGRDRLLL